MTEAAPDRIWWSAAEIADAGLPDMPKTKRKVNAVAKRERWNAHPEYARRRSGRGGGWEYHWKLLPVRAQQALARAAESNTADRLPEAQSRENAWTAWEQLTDAARDKARGRLEILDAVEAMVAGGATRDLAVTQIAEREQVSPRTIWNWLALVDGVRADDRLAYLAPRHQVATRQPRRAECDPAFLEYLKADFLRLEGPSFSTAYRRAVQICQHEGWSVLTEGTARRRLNAEVSQATQIYARKGLEALKRLYPAQRRDKRALGPLEAVNADYHKWDVFVRWPRFDGDTEGEILRPQMVAFQDIYSGRILSWRLDRTPNKSSVALALGDMIERFGIPDHMLLDNGREFANKYLTGQAESRFRFKIKDDDIQGVLVSLGVKIHWATPYSGQSKPIERAFRDMCDAIAKDPRLAGAYTGNRPDAQPENYGSKAIPLDDFVKVVAAGIEEHNARTGRRSEVARGRSFNQVFDEAYARFPIRRATEEQRRLWLMGAEGVKCDRLTGLVRFQGNEYWSDWMHPHAGERVIVRFDPENLWDGLHIYALDGKYLGFAECKAKAGFLDMHESKSLARARTQFMKAEKNALEAARSLSTAELGQKLDVATPAPVAPVVATVVKPVFGKPRAIEPTPDATLDEAHERLVVDYNAARSQKAETAPPEDEALQRFKDALELEARAEDGDEIKPELRRWLVRYQLTAEYQTYQTMLKAYGKDMLG